MNNTLQTGLQVLEALWASQGLLGVSELARGLGKEKSNVHRVLGTLSAHGFVNQDCGTRKYRLGPGWARHLGDAGAQPGRQADAAVWWVGTGRTPTVDKRPSAPTLSFES